MLISKQLGHTLDFSQKGRYFQSKMADIEIFNLPYNPRLNARVHTFYETNDIFIIVKIIDDIGKLSQI